MPPNNEKAKKELVTGLTHFLADTYTLYLKTHNYHWNVKGPMFFTLHTMFETQYTELALAVDAIAERIRTLGARAPGSYKEFGELSQIKESVKDVSAQQMIKDLMQDQLIIVELAKKIFPSAEALDDEATSDLLVQRMQIHEKTAWMLRSLLE